MLMLRNIITLYTCAHVKRTAKVVKSTQMYYLRFEAETRVLMQSPERYCHLSEIFNLKTQSENRPQSLL